MRRCTSAGGRAPSFGRRWARLLPAIVVGACSAGELALPSAPPSGSATALQGAVRFAWEPVEGASRYTVFVSSDAAAAPGTGTVFADATSPLVVPRDAGATWYFRVSATRDGFVSPESDPVGAAPLAIGTNGLVPLAAPAWIASNADPNVHFGYPSFGAGDLDGDGFDDVLVGAMYTTAGGSAFLYRGSAAGLSAAPDWVRASTQTDSHFAKGMSTGDLDGDGILDLVIGAAEFDDSVSNEGRAWLYRGTGDASFFETTESWSQPSGQANSFRGRFLAFGGDMNGDGRDELVVDDHAFDAPQINEGVVGVWYGTTGPIPAAADWTAEGNQADAFLGYALSPRSGDVDADGYADLLVGAYQWDEGAVDCGAAFVYYGGPAGLEPTPSWSTFGENPSNFYGSSLSMAGDVNGDGYDDVIVGAYNFGANDRGKVYVFLGGRGGLATTPVWTYEGTDLDENLGMGVGAAGDVNADGYADVLVGAYNDDDGAIDAGRVLLFLGGPGGPSTEPSWSWTNTNASESAGGIVGSAGDVNGDGSGDIIVGVVSFEGFPVDNGRARVWLGPPASGPSIALTAAADGGTLTLTLATATDPGNTGLLCEIDWGDGSSLAPAPCAAGSQWVHDYAGSGPRTARVRASNAHGLAGEAFARIRVR